MFTIGDEGGLWHLWQLDRGGDWSNWQYVGKPQSGPITSQPAIINDNMGWWAAYAVRTYNTILFNPLNPGSSGRALDGVKILKAASRRYSFHFINPENHKCHLQPVVEETTTNC